MGDHVLSLAVLAFAVDDMKALESVMTSAKPFAFLAPVSTWQFGELGICAYFWSRYSSPSLTKAVSCSLKLCEFSAVRVSLDVDAASRWDQFGKKMQRQSCTPAVSLRIFLYRASACSGFVDERASAWTSSSAGEDMMMC